MTHINAFLADVELKKEAVRVANSELASAQAALEAHPDYVAPKKETVPTRDSKGHFLKNGK